MCKPLHAAHILHVGFQAGLSKSITHTLRASSKHLPGCRLQSTVSYKTAASLDSLPRVSRQALIKQCTQLKAGGPNWLQPVTQQHCPQRHQMVMRHCFTTSDGKARSDAALNVGGHVVQREDERGGPGCQQHGALGMHAHRVNDPPCLITGSCILHTVHRCAHSSRCRQPGALCCMERAVY